MKITEHRTREILNLLGEFADHAPMFEGISKRMFRDTAALIRQLQAELQDAWHAGLDAGREQGKDHAHQPPSAPVGVEGLVAGCRVLLEQYEASGDFTMGGKLTNKPFMMIRDSLNELFGNSEQLPPCRCSDGPYHYAHCPHRDPDFTDPFAELGAAMSGRALAQQPPAEAQPVAWYTDDHLTDKSATTYNPVVRDRWIAKGWPVTPLYAAQPGGSDNDR